MHMTRSRNFIEHDVFNEIMHDVHRLDGDEFHDVDTVYGDMSRLVVAWLACTPPDLLRELYNQLGWKGNANARAIHAAAKAWLAKHHPGRCPVVE
jgi:hypothetical protein